MSDFEYYVDADKINVMRTPKDLRNTGSAQEIVALCATGEAGGMKVALRICDMLNGSGVSAPETRTPVVNPVDTHDWEKQLDKDGNWNLNSVCRRCKCELMPAFRGVSEEGTSPCPATPAQPGDVRVNENLEEYLHNLPQGRLLIGGEFKDVVRPEYLLTSDRDAILAALSAPSAAVTDKAIAAMRAESIYVEHPNGGWLLWNWDRHTWEHVAKRADGGAPPRNDRATSQPVTGE